MIFADGWNRSDGRLAGIRNHSAVWPVQNSGGDPEGFINRLWFRHLDNTDPRAGRLNMLFIAGNVESKRFEDLAETTWYLYE